MKTPLLTLLLLCVAQLTQTQAQSYHNLASAGHSYDLSDKHTTAMSYLRISLPLKLKNGDYLLLNPDLHRQRIVFGDTEKRSCNKTGLGIAHMHMTRTGNVISLLNISHNSETAYAGLHAMQFGAGILINRKLNPNLKLKYGLYVNREFFGLLIVPLLGLDYRIRPKLRVFGIMPQNLRLEYKAGPHLRSVLLFEAPLNTYMLGNTQNRRYLDQRQILLGLCQEFYLSKKLVLQCSVKIPISNSQQIFAYRQTYNANILGIGLGGMRSVNNTPTAASRHGLLLEAGLNYRLELE